MTNLRGHGLWSIKYKAERIRGVILPFFEMARMVSNNSTCNKYLAFKVYKHDQLCHPSKYSQEKKKKKNS